MSCGDVLLDIDPVGGHESDRLVLGFQKAVVRDPPVNR